MSTVNKTTINPFWVKSKDRPDTKKKVYKEIIKWTKLALYLFLTVVGLWGCIQVMAQHEVNYVSSPGSGLEIAYNWGTTWDYRYDAMSALGETGNSYYVLSDFTIDYGPFYAFFVWPASKLVMAIMYSTRGMAGGTNTLLSIFILLLIIRSVTIAISLRSTLQVERLQDIQKKVAEINAKYKGLNDAASKQRKQIETMTLYKKNNYKPLAVFEQIFITAPIYLIIFRIVSTSRPMKYTVLFNIWDLTQSPFTMIFSNFTKGGWLYIFFLLLIIPFQILAQRVPQILSKKRNRNQNVMTQKAKEQYNKNMRTQWILSGVFIIFTAISPAGVGLYFGLSALFTMLQSYLLHKYILRVRNKNKKSLLDI